MGLVVDIANNPRMAQVLGRIEELRRAAAERAESDPERVRLETEVAALYVDVGHYAHWLMRQDPESLARVEEEAQRYAQALGRTALPPTPHGESRSSSSGRSARVLPAPFEDLVDSGARRTSDLHALDTGAMAAIRPHGGDTWDPSPEDQLPELEPVADLDQDDPDAERTDISGLTRHTDSETRDSFPSEAQDSPWDDSNLVALEASDLAAVAEAAKPRMRVATRTPEILPIPAADDGPETTDPEVRADWIAPLRELLDILGGPERADLDEAHPVCVAALVRATTSLELRWVQFPDAVQQALLGYTGARARRLSAASPADADIRLAIGRMERFSLARGLAIVPSLRRDGPARDWRADERRFWAVLHAGL